jgi:hypothetical protein
MQSIENHQITGNDDTELGFNNQGKTFNSAIPLPTLLQLLLHLPPAETAVATMPHPLLQHRHQHQNRILLVTNDVKCHEGFHTHNHYLLQCELQELSMVVIAIQAQVNLLT